MLQYGYSVNKLPQERYRYEFISRSHPLGHQQQWFLVL